MSDQMRRQVDNATPPHPSPLMIQGGDFRKNSKSLQFLVATFDILLVCFVFLFPDIYHFRAKTTMLDMLHPDFALMGVARREFKTHLQFLPDHKVTRTYAKNTPDTDILYQKWEARTHIS